MRVLLKAQTESMIDCIGNDLFIVHYSEHIFDVYLSEHIGSWMKQVGL